VFDYGFIGQRSSGDMLRGFAFLNALDMHNGFVVDKTKKCMKYLNSLASGHAIS